MKRWHHLRRATGRSVWLAVEFIIAGLRWLICVRDDASRARWTQLCAKRMARVFGLRFQLTGPIPPRGFLISNHLGYLDILALGACFPCPFVAKVEVRRWPVLGLFARLAGTLFVDRSRRMDVGRITLDLRTAVEQGTVIVLFPEGTSSDGTEVLPFKSSLLAPAADQSSLAIAHVRYTLPCGNPARDVCYYGDMTLLPHLFHALGHEYISATLRLGSVSAPGQNRKDLARHLQAEVARLGQGGAAETPSSQRPAYGPQAAHHAPLTDAAEALG